MRITFISDLHNHHKAITEDLPGGDLIICAGDISSVGYPHEIENFLKWYSQLNYTHKVFIAGNHDFGFQNNVQKINSILNKFKSSIIYLQDESVEIEGIKIYGTPWTPEFMNWAFMQPRNSEYLENIFSKIPEDVDILITHGPPFGYLDIVKGETEHLGCEVLRKWVDIVKPKIHVFGHIHSGYGSKHINGSTLFINASVLNEQYQYEYKPLTIEFFVD